MADLRTKDEPSTVRRLGRYSILADLAKGGMAQVYVAQRDNAEDICVLKQLLVELEGHDTAAKRFHREAHVASYLIHPNIARVIDAGMEGDTFCLAMEFIAGKDIESMIHALFRDRQMLPYEVSVAVALGALDGLAYAHTARDPSGAPLSLVHRDLSPRNIMLGFDGEVKLIDFGLARGDIDDFRTAPGMILGTLRYVSPEQAMTEPVDHRSDLYSLAVVVFEALAGRELVPHGLKPFETLKHVVSTKAPRLGELNPNLPRALDAVFERALAKDRKLRFASAEEFREALRAAAGPLAKVTRPQLSGFVRGRFPEDAERAEALMERGRRRYRRLREAAERGELVLPTDIGDPDNAEATRTGYVEPTRTGLAVEETRTAPLVLPGGLSDTLVPASLTVLEDASSTVSSPDFAADTTVSPPPSMSPTEADVAALAPRRASLSPAIPAPLSDPGLDPAYARPTMAPEPTPPLVRVPAQSSTVRTMVMIAAAVAFGVIIGLSVKDDRPAPTEVERVVPVEAAPVAPPAPIVVPAPTAAPTVAPVEPPPPPPTAAKPSPAPARKVKAVEPPPARPAPTGPSLGARLKQAGGQLDALSRQNQEGVGAPLLAELAALADLCPRERVACRSARDKLGSLRTGIENGDAAEKQVRKAREILDRLVEGFQGEPGG